MIASLYIKDFALIDELETSFEPGLNIITGETGAGKSIIIGALNILLGERAQLESIRQGAAKAIAEVILKTGEDEKLAALLLEHGVEPAPETIIRREVRHSGSRAFINDTPVQLSVLKQVGGLLVDLHGQHDHQLLLREENHREVIDSRPGVAAALEAYVRSFEAVSELRKQKAALQKRERELREKQELYRFQLRELRAADLKPDETEQLERDIRLLDSSEELNETAAKILTAGRDGKFNALDFLGMMEQALGQMAQLEPEFESYVQELETARISVEELLRFTEQYQTNIEFNPVQLETLRQRQAELRRLEKKYGKSPEALLTYMEEVEQTLSLADNFEAELEKLDVQIQKAAGVLGAKAKALHDARIAEGERLSGDIERELMHLGFRHARFAVVVRWREQSDGWIEIDGKRIACAADGADDLSFYISTNKGEAPKPLSRTASGGEMSRIMLALKSILAREQRLPVMIFDEIDTGISGPIAQQVGRTMRGLADTVQILSITHLPQIACMAHTHYVVRKTETDERTVTRIDRLSEEEHIREVARLMSGTDLTEAVLSSARELVASATAPQS
ncbi:DNA replication and repair protein RecN [Cyclonatronum proteinivorum]|uniref:DNA repair protein RecN n=1 Tax=Cyclonatronum proteinivorum TaxID=1457365 RepID=A0A345UNF0_9BACT|nr:DNA replication and repair protein RecN [Cyclonatronum proteinivorum]